MFPSPNTGLHRQLVEALHQVQKTGHGTLWSGTLHKHPFCDPFAAIFEFLGGAADAQTAFDGRQFHEWILDVDRWRDNYITPGAHKANLYSKFIFYAWDHLTECLSEAIRLGRLAGSVPKRGGVLVYVAGLSTCIIMRYEMKGETPSLKVVSSVQNPLSAFDFWEAIDSADVVARNHLKAILSSGHKLIYVRGNLSHVDRRQDLGVFGPTIDTIAMAELLTREIFEEKHAPVRRAVEIGPGNGLLSLALANYATDLEELCAIDIDFNALACTRRAIQSGIVAGKKIGKKLDLVLVNGRFGVGLIPGRFDLVVCNPPYIPLPPGKPRAVQAEDYQSAVAGLDLIKEVANNLSEILNPQGRLLLMLSSLCEKAVTPQFQDKYIVRPALGASEYWVNFDVEAVVNDNEWLKYLISEGGLKCDNSTYYHKLIPVWISLK